MANSPTHEEIAKRAYSIYQARTTDPLSDVDVYLDNADPATAAIYDWLEAESQLTEEHNEDRCA